MLTKKKLPLLILMVIGIETLIYLWAVWTTDHEFVFNKCARNSGRFSTGIILLVLLLVGFYGLKKIFLNERKKETFLILMTLFSINHFIHLFFVITSFKSHALPFNITDNIHGFITFIFLLILPFISWKATKLSKGLYILIILHLFNVSYFICQTFLSKVTPEKPAYHNQFGILVMVLACIYVLYRVFQENKSKKY